MQFVYLNDLVQAMVRSMEEPRALGEAFNKALGDKHGGASDPLDPYLVVRQAAGPRQGQHQCFVLGAVRPHRGGLDDVRRWVPIDRRAPPPVHAGQQQFVLSAPQ